MTITKEQIMPLIERMMKQFKLPIPEHIAVLPFARHGLRLSRFEGFNVYLQFSNEHPRWMTSDRDSHFEPIVDRMQSNEPDRIAFIGPIGIDGKQFEIGDGDDGSAAEYDPEANILRFWLRYWGESEEDSDAEGKVEFDASAYGQEDAASLADALAMLGEENPNKEEYLPMAIQTSRNSGDFATAAKLQRELDEYKNKRGEG